eukprot:gene18803-22492_t
MTYKMEAAHPQTGSDLNTINSLKFHNMDKNLFISGSRYGSWRMWDLRQPLKDPIVHIQAHMKLNQIHMTSDDRRLLTSGRDGTLRLWDIRAVQSDPSTTTTPGDLNTLTKAYIQRVTMEKLMRKYGDKLFSFYHTNNVPPSTGSTNPEFQKMFRQIEQDYMREIHQETMRLHARLGQNTGPPGRSMDESILGILDQEIDESALLDDDDIDMNLMYSIDDFDRHLQDDLQDGDDDQNDDDYDDNYQDEDDDRDNL